MNDCVNVKPVIVFDCPDAHQVWLNIGVQYFTVGDYRETKEEAEWLANQLRTALASLTNHPRSVPHKFWGGGEADCPTDIKSSNGELHTLRCKVCGQDNNRLPCVQLSVINTELGQLSGVCVIHQRQANLYDELHEATANYYTNYMQDEATEEEDPKWLVCSEEQHKAAKRVKEVLKAMGRQV